MDTFKRFVVSSLTTFVASFTLTFCTAVGSANFTFSKASVIAVGSAALMVAVRAVAKVLVEWATGVTGEPTQ